jgi:hypothetical protein
VDRPRERGLRSERAARGRRGHPHRYRDFTGTIGDFVVAVEESHGALLSSEIRDKDAAGPALVLVEMAARVRAEGRTVPDVLDDLHRTHGVVANRLTSMVMRGAAGQAAIERIQDGLRRHPPAAIGGVRVRRFADHWDEGPGSRFGPIRAETDRAARNVLVFELADESRVIIRPSGTEPKNKTYIEASSGPLAPAEDLDAVRSAVAARARALEEAFVAHCLGLIGAARAAIGRWIDKRLARYGKDPRLLVGEAFAAYAAGEIAACRARGDGKWAVVLALVEELFAEAGQSGNAADQLRESSRRSHFLATAQSSSTVRDETPRTWAMSLVVMSTKRRNSATWAMRASSSAIRWRQRSSMMISISCSGTPTRSLWSVTRRRSPPRFNARRRRA